MLRQVTLYWDLTECGLLRGGLSAQLRSVDYMVGFTVLGLILSVVLESYCIGVWLIREVVSRRGVNFTCRFQGMV